MEQTQGEYKRGMNPVAENMQGPLENENLSLTEPVRTPLRDAPNPFIWR
jgi:hypothetical protein